MIYNAIPTQRVLMVTPKFLPWKGPRYEQGLEGVRLLILGEAQYGDDVVEPQPGGRHPVDLDSTRDFVHRLGVNGPSAFRPFWTKVQRIVMGPEVDIYGESRKAFWESVAFYNYVQWWFPAGKNQVSGFMWDEARDPFLNVVSDLEPHLILALGHRLADHLPPGHVIERVMHPAAYGFTYASTFHVPRAIQRVRTELRLQTDKDLANFNRPK